METEQIAPASSRYQQLAATVHTYVGINHRNLEGECIYACRTIKSAKYS
jgi:hypothetical protein